MCDKIKASEDKKKTKRLFTNPGTPKENLTKYDPWRGICTKMERNPYQMQCCISSGVLCGVFQCVK